MQCNVGRCDKRIRIALGSVLIVLGFVFRSWWGLLGLLPLVTALVGWCPAYVPFKLSTLGVKTKIPK